MAEPTGERAAKGETPRHRTARGTRAKAPSASSGLVLLVAGEEHFATYELPAIGIVSIGRSEDSTICVEEPTLSRQHARLTIDEDLSLEDCGSANGTFVHNRRIDAGVPTAIQLNEAAVLGSVTIIVQRRTQGTERRLLRTNDYFEERLYDECARAERYGNSFAVAHVLSDEPPPTARLHAALSSSLRPSDIVGLYSPRQLDLLLLEASKETAQGVLDRLLDALAAEGFEATSGLAVYGGDGQAPAKLLGAARSRARDLGSGSATEPNGDYIVRDPAMIKIHDLVRRIAAAELTVLVLGETGVGKEVIAEILHRESARAKGPLIRLNCAALTQSLLESELFGHERGAFTGAHETKKGLLEVGSAGTVFLDEVGEMPLDTQVKLLRVLEERHVIRVGGTKSTPIDVRFVAATHRDLEEAIASHRFRADLFYRLNAFSIVVPPLRERRAEIEPLARFFIARLCQQLERAEPVLSAPAVELLTCYPWPGNIRELRNAVERATILAVGDVIEPHHLPEKVRDQSAATPRTTGQIPIVSEPTASLSPRRTSPPPGGLRIKRKLSADEERALVVAALDETGGNQTEAAKILGISRRTLMNKLDLYGIPRPRKKQ